MAKNGQKALFGEIFSNLLQFAKYLAVYHCFVTRLHGHLSLSYTPNYPQGHLSP